MITRLWPALASLLCVLLVLAAWSFIEHSAGFGWRGLTGTVSRTTYLWSETPFANPAIFGHMLAGAALTALAPLQLIPFVRRRWPRIHRASGYLIAILALLAGIGGLLYMALRPTIGGALMTFAFTVYGGLVVLAAVQTLRFARARQFVRHRNWALRLFVLAIGSWIYRVHYGLWYTVTGGLETNRAFTGLFDQVNLFAFYLPYLLILEGILRLTAGTSRAPQPQAPRRPSASS